MAKRKYSVGIWAFGSCSNRFCEPGYQQSRTFAEKIACASRVKGLEGVEIHYNGDFDKENVKEIKKIIDDSGLKVSAINCETFGDKIFSKGAFISLDPKIRQKAIDIVKEAAEISEYFEGTILNIWPGSEGFDYPFQIDYCKEWDLFIDAIKQITSAAPKVKFSLEYKIREPRMRSTIGTVGKALMVINEIGKENLGITIDFGHSIMAKESPAESAALLHRYNKLFHIHLNDNTREWDDDLIPCSYNLWDTLEFIYYLNKIDYKGWIGFDMTPWREDQIEAVKYSIDIIEKMFNIAGEIDTEELWNAQKNTDALAAHKFIINKLLK